MQHSKIGAVVIGCLRGTIDLSQEDEKSRRIGMNMRVGHARFEVVQKLDCCYTRVELY